MNLVVDLLSFDDIRYLAKVGVKNVIVSDGNFGIKGEVSCTPSEIESIRIETNQLAIKLFVNVNSLFHESELSKLEEYISFLFNLNVDYIIFSDMAVYMFARRMGKAKKLIFASETFVTNNFEVNYWIDRVSSAIISNELSLEELMDMSKNAKSEVGYMVYGYHSMFYSKRELLTNYFTYKGKNDKGIVNNRNLRIVEEIREDQYPIVQDEKGTHIYTGKIFCLFKELIEFENTNLKNLFISANFIDKSNYFRVIEIYQRAIFALESNSFMGLRDQLFEELVAIDSNINTSHLYSKSVLSKAGD